MVERAGPPGTASRTWRPDLKSPAWRRSTTSAGGPAPRRCGLVALGAGRKIPNPSRTSLGVADRPGAVVEQLVAARARRAVYRPWYDPDVDATVDGSLGGDQAAAGCVRFDDHDHRASPAMMRLRAGEAPGLGGTSRERLGEHHADADDLLPQPGVTPRIGNVDPAGRHSGRSGYAGCRSRRIAKTPVTPPLPPRSGRAAPPSAPAWAAPSMPRARPETTQMPAAARSRPSSNATARPSGVARRVPTMATQGRARWPSEPLQNRTPAGSGSLVRAVGILGLARARSPRRRDRRSEPTSPEGRPVGPTSSPRLVGSVRRRRGSAQPVRARARPPPGRSRVAPGRVCRCDGGPDQPAGPDPPPGLLGSPAREAWRQAWRARPRAARPRAAAYGAPDGSSSPLPGPPTLHRPHPPSTSRSWPAGRPATIPGAAVAAGLMTASSETGNTSARRARASCTRRRRTAAPPGRPDQPGSGPPAAPGADHAPTGDPGATGPRAGAGPAASSGAPSSSRGMRQRRVAGDSPAGCQGPGRQRPAGRPPPTTPLDRHGAPPSAARSSATSGRSTTTRRSKRSSSGPDTRDAYRARAASRHRHDPGPPSAPQGQGFMAATRSTRAGNTTLALARQTSTRPSSSGWRRVSRTSEGNSPSSSRNRTP